jgi:excisionase family DNA binding protein
MIVFRVSQLARDIGVHRNTISNWIKSGKLPASPTAGKRYMVPLPEFGRFCRQVGISEEIIASLTPAGRSGQAKLQAAQPQSQPILQPQSNLSEVRMSDKPIGSVMVVGGGIAGIQASLDLANSGYFVHLVERSAGIGGVMAQLDKTYPTNDCAM